MYRDSLNILLITVRADFGGGPEHVYTLLKALYKNNNFYIACPDDYPYKERYSGILGPGKIIIIPHRKFTYRDLFRLKKFVSGKNIDIIHSHGKGAGIYSRLLYLLTGKPVIHTFHGLHTGRYGRMKKIIYLVIERILSFFTEKIISVSKGEYGEITGSHAAPASKIVIIENAVEIPGRGVYDSNFYTVPRNIVTFTRFDYQKNSSLLLEIYSELRKLNIAADFKITLLGTGEEENKIKEMVNAAGLALNFNFAGAVENPRSYLENAFCYLSTSRWEGLPLSVLEAMACGVPVVATDVTGNNDIVENRKTGFLYNPADPGEAARSLEKLSADFSLWKELSSASRKKIIENYSVDKMTGETEKLYRTAGRLHET